MKVSKRDTLSEACVECNRVLARGNGNRPYLGDLFKQALVLDADVSGAVDAYTADAQAGVFPVGDRYGLDLSAAGDAHVPARKV